MDEPTVGVHFSSPTNSTMFTDCCEMAVLGYQERCPRCSNLVVPAIRRWAMAMRKQRRFQRWMIRSH